MRTGTAIALGLLLGLVWGCGGGGSDGDKTDSVGEQDQIHNEETTQPPDVAADPGGTLPDSTEADLRQSDSASPADLSDATEPGSDAQADAPAPPMDIGGDLSLDEFLAVNNIHKMEQVEADREGSLGTTDADGRASFYSPAHNALVEFWARDEEDEPRPDVQVSLTLFDNAQLVALVMDPTGEGAPAFYEGELQDGNLEIESDGDLADGVEFEEGGANPFEGQPFSLLSISVTMVVKVTLKAAITGAIAYVVKKWVKELCLFAAPLHKEACNIASLVAGLAAGVAMGGVQLALKEGLTWTGLAALSADELIKFGCGDVLGAVLAAYGPVEGLATMGEGSMAADNQKLFKQAAWKYNYMMEHLDSADTGPTEATAGELSPGITKGLKALAVLKPMIIQNYFIAMNPDKGHLETQLSSGNLFNYATDLVKDAVTEHIFTITKFIDYKSLLIEADEWIFEVAGEWHMVQEIKVEYFHYQCVEGEWSTKKLAKDNKYLNCGLAAVGAITGYLQDATGNIIATKNAKPLMEYVHNYLVLLNMQADALYEQGWPGTIEPPDCLPDIWEPNNSWEYAPTVVNLGSAVEVEDLLLFPDEEDWYRFPLGGLINRVQAAAEWDDDQVGLSSCAPAGGKVCLEFLWYSDMYEMLDMPPSEFMSPVCQDLSEDNTWFETDQYLLAPVMGETGYQIFVRVFSDGGNSSNIPYHLHIYGTD